MWTVYYIIILSLYKSFACDDIFIVMQEKIHIIKKMQTKVDRDKFLAVLNFKCSEYLEGRIDRGKLMWHNMCERCKDVEDFYYYSLHFV